MKNDLQVKIIEYLENNNHADGIDVATALNIPIDVAYSEVQSMIDDGLIHKEYIGLETRLVVESAGR